MKASIYWTILLVIVIFNQGWMVEKNSQDEIDRPFFAVRQDTADYFLKQGSVVGFHFMKHKEDYNQDQNRRFLLEKYFPEWQNLVPGSKVHYLRGERGSHKEKEVFCWVFRDLQMRDHYFPEADKPSDEYQLYRSSINWLYEDQTFYKHNEGWIGGLSSDYLVIAAGNAIERNWLAKGTIVGLHHMKLKDGVDNQEFEEFISQTWSPNRSDALPGTKVFFLKGLRGHEIDEYVFMFILESKKVRDKYFPRQNEFSGEYLKFKENWKWLYAPNYIDKYLDHFITEEQSDLVVMF